MDATVVLRILVAFEILVAVAVVAAALAAGPARQLRRRRLAHALDQFEKGRGRQLHPRSALRVMSEMHRQYVWVRGGELERLADRLVESGIDEKIFALLSHRRVSVRAEAAYVIPLLRSKEVAAALVPALNDPDLDVRLAATRGLIEMFTGMPALAETAEGKQALSLLVRALGLPPSIPQPHLAGHLAKLGRIGVPSLLDGLGRLDAVGRAVCVRILGVVKDLRAMSALLDALGDESLDVRAKAAEALGQLGDPKAVPPLVRSLRDPDWPVRAQAAKALGLLGDPAAAPWLQLALTDQAWWVRSNSAYALRRLGKVGIATLRVALLDDDRFAREQAAVNLEEAGEGRRWLEEASQGSSESERALEDLIASGGLMEAADVLHRSPDHPVLHPIWQRGISRLRQQADAGDQWAEGLLRKLR